MTVTAGRHFFLQFDGALTMTHHATNLDLPGEADITTAAGDVAEFFSTGSNTVQCVNYTLASSAPGGGGGWEFVSATTASTDASIAFTGLESGYDYMMQGVGVLPANDGVDTRFRVGVTGPTYRTSNYVGSTWQINGSGSASGYDGYTTQVTLNNATNGNAADEHMSFEMIFFDPVAATDTYLLGYSSGHNTASDYHTGGGSGHYTSAESHTAVQFSFTAGNVSVGYFKLFRRANA